MKAHFIFSLLFIVICTICLTSCNSRNEPKHFLWKVSNSDSSIYILGSIHLADSSFYPLDTAITNAFDRSDELAVEIDISDDSVLQEIATLNETHGMFHGEDSLENVLPDSVRNSLDSICTLWSIPTGTFNRYKPWPAAMTLNSIGIMRLGYNYNLGIDSYFLQLAHETGKDVISLESSKDQAMALTGEGVDDSVGIYFMMKTLREVGLIDSSVSWMMQAWKTGDDSLFWNALNADTSKTNERDSLFQKVIDERIFQSRNRAMADAIEKLLARKRKVFVVVGAAHLIGENGNIIDILRRKGFTVERL